MTIYYKSQSRWMVVLSIFFRIFFICQQYKLVFHWHLFFYFISNNNILRFCGHFTCLSSKMQNAIKLENISNLITSPSSYQCKKTRLVPFIFHGRHTSKSKSMDGCLKYFFQNFLFMSTIQACFSLAFIFLFHI
jgi:hypothetical protein